MWKSYVRRRDNQKKTLACNRWKLYSRSKKKIRQSDNWHNFSLSLHASYLIWYNAMNADHVHLFDVDAKKKKLPAVYGISAAFFYHFIIQFHCYTAVTLTYLVQCKHKPSKQPIKYICDQWINEWMNWIELNLNWTWMNLKKWEFDTPSIKIDEKKKKKSIKETKKKEKRYTIIFTCVYVLAMVLFIAELAAIKPWLCSPAVKFFCFLTN